MNRANSKLFGRELGRKPQLKNKLDDITAFTVHELRRTCCSLLAVVGVPGHIAEHCLKHKLKGTEGIYDRYYLRSERNFGQDGCVY